MATIKSFTSLEQSKVLAKILPLESADMHYSRDFDGSWFVDLAEYTSVKIPKYVSNVEEHLLPCWSLATLLEQIPSDIKTKDGCNYTLEIEKCDAEHLPCGLNYHDNWGRGEDIITHYYDNFIDSSYEMIVKLHELKLL